MSSGRRDKSTPISYQPPGAQWDVYSMSNVGQRVKNPGQSHSSTDPMVDPRQQQQQEHQQRRQEHMHTETQPNPQLLTPQSGTAQRPIRTDFPNASITKPSQEPSKRTLPPTDVTDENLDERYVQFILYCNPSISDAVDTTELRVGLRSPPRSDGKNYSPFVIFRLISRLEAKDIKSWTSLVVEMGVELPDARKNQSTQKVQQYAVRLKRWLHAYHIDAFFHYCLGIPNVYYSKIPAPAIPLGDAPRDGIAPEDDLALRALCPEWRPKRGRRRVDDEAELETSRTVRQRQSLRQLKSTEPPTVDKNDINNSQSLDEQMTQASASSWTALPRSPDPWSAAHTAIAPRPASADFTSSSNPGGLLSTASASQQASPYQLQWRIDPTASPSAQSGQNQDPNSAVTATPHTAHPGSQHPQYTQFSPPTPSTGKRKRQSSAVSSAWQGGRDGTSGKIRGRPPRDRSVVDGQFSTFPANPDQQQQERKGSGSQTRLSSAADQPQQQQPHPHSKQGPDIPAIAPKSPAASHPKPQVQISGITASGRKPSRLQLQVPTHEGGPVILAEPPQVLINGEATPEIETVHRDSGVSFPEEEEEDENHDDDEDEEGEEEDDEGFGYNDDDDDDYGGGGGTFLDHGPTTMAGGKDPTVELITPRTPEEARKWKRKAKILEKKLRDKDEELRGVKRRVLEAVM